MFFLCLLCFYEHNIEYWHSFCLYILTTGNALRPPPEFRGWIPGAENANPPPEFRGRTAPGFLPPPISAPGIPGAAPGRGRKSGAVSGAVLPPVFSRPRFSLPIPAPGIPGVDPIGGGNRGRKSGGEWTPGNLFLNPKKYKIWSPFKL